MNLTSQEEMVADQSPKRQATGRGNSLQSYDAARPTVILEILGRLLSSFPERDGTDTGMDSRLRGFLVAVEGVSLPVLLEAERRLLRGTVADIDPRFMPTPPQLARLCDYIRGEFYRRDRPLSAQQPDYEPSLEERERMLERFAALSKKLGEER